MDLAAVLPEATRIPGLAREMDLASFGPRPRDWDRIRDIQNELLAISAKAREYEKASPEDRVLAVIGDEPSTVDELVSRANERLRLLADACADVRLAFGGGITFSIAEFVTREEAARALRALARRSLVRRTGMLRTRWVRIPEAGERSAGVEKRP